MSRRVVAIEGEPTTDGRLIEHGALRWKGDPVPIYASATGAEFPVLLGKAMYFQREDDGKITAEVELARAMGEDERLAVSLMDMDTVNEGDLLRIRRGRIYDLMLTTGWAWPDA